MKLLYDFLPILLFFIAYKFFGLYVATAVAIGAAFLQVSIHWLRFKRWDKMQVITLILIVVLGGATLLLRDEIFIKWKPTIINWLFALVFLGSQFIGDKPVIQRLIGQQIVLPAAIWQRLSLSWVIFFFLLGVVNLWVVYNFSTDAWVNFKLFGMLGLTVLFVIVQAIYLGRYMNETSKNK